MNAPKAQKIHIKKIKPSAAVGPGTQAGGSCAPTERD